MKNLTEQMRIQVAYDERYVYVRNYMPHRIYGQHLGYMFETPTTRVWKELHDDGKRELPQIRSHIPLLTRRGDNPVTGRAIPSA